MFPCVGRNGEICGQIGRTMSRIIASPPPTCLAVSLFAWREISLTTIPSAYIYFSIIEHRWTTIKFPRNSKDPYLFSLLFQKFEISFTHPTFSWLTSTVATHAMKEKCEHGSLTWTWICSYLSLNYYNNYHYFTYIHASSFACHLFSLFIKVAIFQFWVWCITIIIISNNVKLSVAPVDEINWKFVETMRHCYNFIIVDIIFIVLQSYNIFIVYYNIVL